MKAIKYIIFTTSIIGSTLFVSSCKKDFLEKSPYGQFTVDQMDESSVEGLMASAYAGLQGHFFGNNESFSAPVSNWIFDVRSDDAYKGGGGLGMEGYITDLELSNFNSDNPTGLNKWRNNYFAIARVHKAMQAINDLAPAGKESLLGELRLIRGHFYFDLLRIFERIPYLDEKTDPTTATSDQFSREEIFGKIKDDFQYAYDNLPPSQQQIGRFNKYAAAAYMCKLLIETEKWGPAVDWADIVIGSNKYQLYNNYLDLSKIEFNNKAESVFTIQFSTDNNNAHVNWGNLLNTTYSEGIYGNGDDFFLASQNLVNAFRTDANGLPYLDTFNDTRLTSSGYTGNVDPRLDFTVGRIGFPFRGHTYNMNWTRDYATYGEHSGKKGLIASDSPDIVNGFPWGASPLNYNLIRYAEVLLWKAEAIIESNGDLSVARSLINEVRQKAKRSLNDLTYTPIDLDRAKANYKVEEYPSTGFSQNFARKALRMERRLELAMEGHRWFDLVRWKAASTILNKYYNEEKVLRNWMSDASFTNNETYLPIPREEVEKSGGLYK